MIGRAATGIQMCNLSNKREKKIDCNEKEIKEEVVLAIIVRTSLIRETSGPLARQPKRVIIGHGR